MQGTYFFTGPKFNLLFYCHVILYSEELNLSGKFQLFNAIYASFEMLKNR